MIVHHLNLAPYFAVAIASDGIGPFRLGTIQPDPGHGHHFYRSFAAVAVHHDGVCFLVDADDFSDKAVLI